jgi:hypothetical protein
MEAVEPYSQVHTGFLMGLPCTPNQSKGIKQQPWLSLGIAFWEAVMNSSALREHAESGGDMGLGHEGI